MKKKTPKREKCCASPESKLKCTNVVCTTSKNQPYSEPLIIVAAGQQSFLCMTQKIVQQLTWFYQSQSWNHSHQHTIPL